MKSTRLDFILKGSLLFLLYFISAREGLRLDAVSGFATLVWFPTGISIAALFLFGNRLWPFVFLAAFLANIATGAPIPAAIGIGIGNMLEAAVAAFSLRRIGFHPAFNRLIEVYKFVIFILLCTTISATIGVSSLFLGHVINLNAYPLTWLAWWIGDSVSGLLFTPLILIWVSSRKFSPNFNFKKLLELIIIVSLLGLFAWVVFFGIPLGVRRPLTYLIFPPLLWIGLRFSPRIVTLLILILSLFAMIATAQGYGPFAMPILSQSLIYLQIFIGIIAGTILILASIIAERERLERKKDEFISVASHELKTPLTSIKILTELMQKQSSKRGDRKFVSQAARINKQVDRMIGLARELLDVRKIQDDNNDYRPERFNINNLIKEIVLDISHSTKRKIIIKAQEKVIVTADKNRIDQVITNLISNAIKYSPKSKRIIVKLTHEDDLVKVGVQDFGLGVPTKEQEKIFNRFYKLDKAKIKEDTSSGLGLYIAREIIRLHKGQIWVESPSRNGRKRIKGSTFYFSLPVSTS